MANAKKPWSGRFKEKTAGSVEKFTASIHYDKRLYPFDIDGSIAHVSMLAKQNIISKKEALKIISSLKNILKDIETGKFMFDSADEDIHMGIERELIRRLGTTGGKVHSARSRNDQVVLDTRLFLRSEIKTIIYLLRCLQKELIKLAKSEIRTILPGYTHMQKAQPVLLSHYFLAFLEMFERDVQRLNDCQTRVNVCPLGSAALAGTSLPIDRNWTSRTLEFAEVSRNSMDAVADRDFIAEFIFDSSVTMMHLSRFCEDLVLWSTDEFRFIEISDAYTTGSSIMPQKKNPDVAELVRGKTGRVYGRLTAMLVTMKALPLSYNRDLQEDKEGLFDTIDTLLSTLKVFTGMISAIKISTKDTERALKRGYILATDLADYLVRKGESFRSAHGIVARLVGYAERKGKSFSELDLNEYKEFSPLFEEDVRSISIMSSLKARNIIGGTAPAQVEQALTTAKKILNEAED